MTDPSRRRFLMAAGVGALATGCTVGAVAAEPAVVEPGGERQPGVDRPGVPQPHVRLSVFDGPRDPAALRSLLVDIGATAAALATAAHPALTGFPPARLTTTVGLGPAAVAALDPRLPGTVDLPPFPGDTIDPGAVGGDVMLQICADNPAVLSLAAAALLTVAGGRLRPRWSQQGFRGGSAPDGSTRNLLGFTDGITVPRTEADLRREVWRDDLPGSTIAVVRRMRLDLAGFAALPLTAQEAAVGRRRDTDEPLSGGGPAADVDLNAKTPEGEFLLPVASHARRAHPAATGSGLMLRRGYAYDNATGSDAGQLFICFQRDLRTFVATQFRLADDALMRYATTTASGTFLVVPGAMLRA